MALTTKTENGITYHAQSRDAEGLMDYPHVWVAADGSQVEFTPEEKAVKDLERTEDGRFRTYGE